MRSLFVIRDKLSDSYCSSSKHSYFNSFAEAAIFNTIANAAKAMKEMNRDTTSWNNSWMLHGKYLRHTPDPHNTTQTWELEVVECELIPKCDATKT
jgi:hypothetical protein